MEPFINNNETSQEQSQFCDTLMNVTGALQNLRRKGDSAIVLCSDRKSVSSRQAGNYPDVLQMVLAKMLADDQFAELMTEACLLYSKSVRTIQPEGKEEQV